MAVKFIGLAVSTVALSLAAIGIEAASIEFPGRQWVLSILILSVPFLYLAEVLLRWKESLHKALFLRRNIFDFIMLSVVFLASVYMNYLFIFQGARLYQLVPLALICLRSGFFIAGRLVRIRRFAVFIGEFTLHPAQVILLSFLAVILTGTVLLLLPFSTISTESIRIIDALFTATSAVCVTGLITVDTATVYTVWGHAVIAALIQIGGLGIMVISYFVLFSFGRSVSVEHKILVSYMLSENDMTQLKKNLSNIMGITFAIEALGALALLPSFSAEFGFTGKAVFYSVFHSVSAFCNAGFALFTDNLEGFKSEPAVLLPVAFLIISGGLSFPVLSSLLDSFRRFLRRLQGGAYDHFRGHSANTKLVLSGTLILVVAGTFLTYAFEHGNTLRTLPLGQQYLNAFFQSVTYRTAGFNSISFGILSDALYAIIIVFMFIGGASGSTAGGIKVNTAGVILAFIRSAFRNADNVILFRNTVRPEIITRSFAILVFALTAVFGGAIILSLTEDAPFLRLLFEAVSAFGTVGLSAGITASLSTFGKLIIITLMYIGRVGPLTLVAAAAIGRDRHVEFPNANLYIG